MTPFECSVPWEKKPLPPHSAVQIFSSSGFEEVSCKLKIVAFWLFKWEKIALLLFVLRNPLTFKERIFNLCAILFYGGDKKFINMLWLWWLKTGKSNKLKLTALNIFENKVNKTKKTQLKRLWDRETHEFLVSYVNDLVSAWNCL